PCELPLPYGPPGTTDWSRAAEHIGTPVSGMRLRALHVGGALHGPVAHGLACGALLCVSNGSLWNAPAWHGSGYAGERRRLREWWGITTRAEWQQHLRNLLAAEASSSDARMRADGILDENRHVTSVEAWDLGRASKMARWGLGARFCTLPETESALVRAGRAASLAYRSWPDFSAGYILGRCLHFDEEEFGPWYQDMVAAHRILTSDPGSPWLNIPFR
ncbi:DUF1266 domain-containing protein, partial [Streptomyces sp. MBT62]|uniref:DUF1266 domain-containing protein n=1 Tax=Streptomyces sp. MBT62 TaxID=2800410 RepID=UPI001909C787